jgi:hypothetical protein
MKFNFLYFIFLLIIQSLFGQTITHKEKSMITEKEINIRIEGGTRQDLATVIRPNLITIYRRDVNGLGLHNPCVYDVMMAYGMKYDLVPEGQRVSQKRYFWHNFKANWRLFWRNGFFWKSRMHKKMKECRIASGEIDLEDEK